jgi:uridine phosphorylase
VTLGVITGLAYEAECLRRAFGATSIAIEVTGGQGARVAPAARRLLDRGATALLSFGMAGGLDPALAPGRIVIGEGVLLPDGRVLPADQVWGTALRLAALPEGASFGIVAGVDAPITAVADKYALHRHANALAVDMESHAVALAAEGRAALAVVRIIVDPATRVVPVAAVAAMRDDGGIDLPALLRSLLRRPGQVPGMIMLARDAAAARIGLRRAAALAATASPLPLREGLGEG